MKGPAGWSRNRSVIVLALAAAAILVGSLAAVKMQRLSSAYAQARQSLGAVINTIGETASVMEGQERLDAAKESLDTAEASLLRLKRESAPVLLLLSPLSKLPFVGGDLHAAPLLLDAGLSLTRASKLTLAGVEPALQLAWQPAVSSDFYTSMGEALETGGPSFREAATDLDAAEIAIGKVDKAALSQRFGQYLQLVEKSLPQLRLVVAAGLEAPRLLAPLGQVQRDLGRLKTTLSHLSWSDAEGIDGLAQELALAEQSLMALRDEADGLAAVLPLLDNLPAVGLGPDIRVAPQLLDAVIGLARAARLILEGAAPVMKLAADGAWPEDLLRDARSSLEASQPSFSKAREELDLAEQRLDQLDRSGLSAETRQWLTLADDYVPLLKSAITLGPAGPRLLDTFIDARHQLAEATPWLSSLNVDALTSEKLDEVKGKLGELRAVLASVRNELDRLSLELDSAAELPWVGAGMASLRQLLEAGTGLIEAGELGIEGAQELDILPTQGLFTETFSRETGRGLEGARARFAASLAKLGDTQEVLDELDGLGLSAEVASVRKAAQMLQSYLEQGQAVVDLSWRLLGFEGPKTYLLLGQKEAEIRATGGFIGSIWEITLSQGEMVGLRFLYSPEVESVYVNTRVDFSRYLPPPEPLWKYMWAGVWLFRDSNWFPDFPTSARIAETMYQRAQGVDVDGIIAFTGRQARYLVEALGPFTIPGLRGNVNVDGQNVEELLIKGIPPPAGANPRNYSARTWFSQTIGEVLLDRLKQGLTIEETGRVVQALQRGLAEKEALVYLDDEQAQQWLRENNWDGRVLPSETDYLLVVNSDLYGSIAEALGGNVERRLDYHVQLNEDKTATGELRLEYKNPNPSNPGPCVQGEEGCFWDYLRVYLPPGSVVLSRPEFPLPPGSLYYRYGHPAEMDTFTATEQADPYKLELGGFFVLPGQAATELSFKYNLPFSLEAEGKGTYLYQLLWQKQPGTWATPVTVTVSFPESWQVEKVEPAAESIEKGQIIFNVALDRDSRFQVRLQTGGE
ncbi:MAG: DUF4012 domain-containing protein [Chloroflexi bacterium]|nr:DUF4012 domain-containing protein [Chloroflexota bacterium]